MRRLASLALSLILVVLLCAVSYAAWISEDIGTTDVGSTVQTGNDFTIMSGGADIWSTADSFRLVYQEVRGDFEISANVVSLENTNEWGKAGVMARGSNAPESWYTFSFVTVANGMSFQWREVDGGGGAPDGSGIAGAAPYWVMLTRQGNNFFGYRSLDGVTWEYNNTQGQPNTITIADAADTILVGLAHTSHAEGTIGTSELADVLLTGETAVSPKEKLTMTWGGIKAY